MTLVAVGILRNNDKILICQRKQGGRYALKWEFPGGKLEDGETVLECLVRELREELSITVESIGKIETLSSRYQDGGLFKVSYCHIEQYTGTPRNNVFEQIRWVKPKDLPDFDILEGNRPIITALSSHGLP